MGLIADILAAGKGIDINPPTTALDKIIIRELNEVVAQGDIELPVAFQARDEVQTLTGYTVDHTGGTFDLIFTMSDGKTFTIAAIAYNASGSAIENAIDTADKEPDFPFWVNGTIDVVGAALNTSSAPIDITYQGFLGGANHPEVVFDGSNLTGGTSASPTVSTVMHGQTNRPAWAATVALGLARIDEVPAQGADAGILTGGDPSNPSYPSEATIRALADEVAIEDGNIASRDAILVAARLN